MNALQSIRLLFFFVLLRDGSSHICSSQYLQQPPTMLDCDPLGIYIVLKCSTASTSSDNVIWYWTQNVSEAGVSGTAILPRDTSDNYQVSSIGTNSRQIGFTVNESTLGYYWCEISNDMFLRPSTITPVCLSMSSSQQKKCNRSHILDLHHYDTECAEEGSATNINRPPLPTSCARSLISISDATPSPSAATMTASAATMTPAVSLTTPSVAIMTPNASTMTSIVAKMTPSAATMTPRAATVTPAYTLTVTTSSGLPTPQQSLPFPAVVAIGVLVVVLVVVVVVITALVNIRRKNNTAAKKGGEHGSHNGPEVLTQQPSIELEIWNNEAQSPQHLVSFGPHTSAGHGETWNALPIYAQPDMPKKCSHQEDLADEFYTGQQEGFSNPMYSKMARETHIIPLPVTFINIDQTHNHPDFPTVSQTQIPATFDPEYDEVVFATKLEHKDKQPASPANTAAFNNLVVSDVVPTSSSGKAGSTLPIYAQPDMSKKHSHQMDLAADLDTAPQVGIFNAVSQKQMSATFDPEYDAIASTMKLEYREEQPASPANMAAYYNVVASDVVPTPSSGEAESNLSKHSHQKDLPTDPRTALQEGISNPVYNKMARETTTSSLPVNSNFSDSEYSYLDLPAVSKTQMQATFDPEYDEITSTVKLEQSDKPPASPANVTAYYNVVSSETVPNTSHKCTPQHSFDHVTPVPYVIVDSMAQNQLSESRTNGGEDKSNNRNLVLFDDPSYAAPALNASDNGNKTGRFQLSDHYKDDPHYQNQ